MKKKIVFVLGGSGLIGNAVIELLLKQNKFDLINLDIKKRKKSNFIYTHENFYKFDCNSDNLDLKISRIIKKFGVPDIFINCSYPKTNDWEKNSFKEIKYKSLNNNIKSHLSSTCYIAKLMADANVKIKKKCSIVLVSSIYGLVGQDLSIYKNTSIKEKMTYSIMKGGILSFTKQMASYYSRKGIRINNVCPGGVIDKSKIKSKKYATFVKNYSSRCPIGRLAEPKEIAASIVFLSSEDSSYITGTSLVIDGGWTAI